MPKAPDFSLRSGQRKRFHFPLAHPAEQRAWFDAEVLSCFVSRQPCVDWLHRRRDGSLCAVAHCDVCLMHEPRQTHSELLRCSFERRCRTLDDRWTTALATRLISNTLRRTWGSQIPTCGSSKCKLSAQCGRCLEQVSSLSWWK